MASPVDLDPFSTMGFRLDILGKKANHGIVSAFKKLDPVEVATSVALAAADADGYVDPGAYDPEEEEDEVTPIWQVVMQTMIDLFMEAHLGAMDAATEYLSLRVTSPVRVAPGPFLGRAGTQTVEQFVTATPTVVGRRIAAGMDPAEALAQSEQLLAAMAESDAHTIGRDVVATAANNDPRFTKYERVANPGACSWCQMLAGRGAVYTVDTANTTRDGQKYHTPYLNGSGKLVGGYCKCSMVAVPDPDHANPAKYRQPRAGDKSAVRAAYQKGSQTPERAAQVRRQLDILRAHSQAGLGNDWTAQKIRELEVEQLGLMMVPTFAGRSVNQPREPAGSSKGGQFASKPGGAVKVSVVTGGGVGLLEEVEAPEGWTEVGLGLDDPKYVTFQMKHPDGYRVTVKSDVWDYGGEYASTSDVHDMRAATAEVARHLGPVAQANPLRNHLSVTVGQIGTPDTGGTTVTKMDRGTATSRITINADLFKPSSGMLEGFRESSNEGYHDRATGIDPLRSIVTHEYGHAFANDGGRREASEMNMSAVFGSDRAMFETMSAYGRTDPGEGYAEAFQSWAMRDVAPPLLAAEPMAELEGWA